MEGALVRRAPRRQGLRLVRGARSTCWVGAWRRAGLPRLAVSSPRSLVRCREAPAAPNASARAAADAPSASVPIGGRFNPRPRPAAPKSFAASVGRWPTRERLSACRAAARARPTEPAPGAAVGARRRLRVDACPCVVERPTGALALPLAARGPPGARGAARFRPPPQRGARPSRKAGGRPPCSAGGQPREAAPLEREGEPLHGAPPFPGAAPHARSLA